MAYDRKGVGRSPSYAARSSPPPTTSGSRGGWGRDMNFSNRLRGCRVTSICQDLAMTSSRMTGATVLWPFFFRRTWMKSAMSHRAGSLPTPSSLNGGEHVSRDDRPEGSTATPISEAVAGTPVTPSGPRPLNFREAGCRGPSAAGEIEGEIEGEEEIGGCVNAAALPSVDPASKVAAESKTGGRSERCLPG